MVHNSIKKPIVLSEERVNVDFWAIYIDLVFRKIPHWKEMYGPRRIIERVSKQFCRVFYILGHSVSCVLTILCPRSSSQGCLVLNSAWRQRQWSREMHALHLWKHQFLQVWSSFPIRTAYHTGIIEPAGSWGLWIDVNILLPFYCFNYEWQILLHLLLRSLMSSIHAHETVAPS